VHLVLWMQEAGRAEAGVVRRWLEGPRWSMEQMAQLADADRFWEMRNGIRWRELVGGLPESLDFPHPLSAADVAELLKGLEAPSGVVRRILASAGKDTEPLHAARTLHTMGSAIEALGLEEPAEGEWLGVVSQRLEAGVCGGPGGAGRALKDAAFRTLREAVRGSVVRAKRPPVCALKADQIVWGRAPVRLDLAGGWTDTPPYSLEYGGAVVNAAVDLNGQPPVQVFARLCPQRHVRFSSIDLGQSETVEELEELLDYGSPQASFCIPKAALALCGFSPHFGPWPDGTTLGEMLEKFGGGIELTLLCAVPKGSGLGTSSILGGVVLAVLSRMMGVELSRQELFHRVLALEQILTTGGGWQDQVGGIAGGLKHISTEPALVPKPTVHWLPHDAFSPSRNGGRTLLYYTGITRLAKDILRNVVGRYLDRDREVLWVLEQLSREAANVWDALARRDYERFGRAIGDAWELNKMLDAGSTTPEVEALLARVAPYCLGAKLLGAGGGGFLLMACRTPEDAARVRKELDADPPNELARFFSYEVNTAGLEVTVS